MELLPLFIAVIPLLIALYKTEWGIWAFLFMIPGYALRVSVGSAEVSMVEIAAVLLGVRLAIEIVCARFHIHSSAKCSSCEKLALTTFTKKPRLLAIRSLDMLSFSTSFGNFKHIFHRAIRTNNTSVLKNIKFIIEY